MSRICRLTRRPYRDSRNVRCAPKVDLESERPDCRPVSRSETKLMVLIVRYSDLNDVTCAVAAFVDSIAMFQTRPLPLPTGPLKAAHDGGLRRSIRLCFLRRAVRCWRRSASLSPGRRIAPSTGFPHRRTCRSEATANRRRRGRWKYAAIERALLKEGFHPA